MYLLCAMDGSDIALENSKANKQHFDCSGSAKDAAAAMASIAYDPLNRIILDAGLWPYKTDEHEAARAHLKAVSELRLTRGTKLLVLAYDKVKVRIEM
jgi:hypothetical protein